MLVSPHAATGAAIGALFPQATAAVPLSVASHYLLDTVPHWQETLPPYTPTRATWVRIPLDLGLALGLAAWIARSNPTRTKSVLLGALGAVAPDFDSAIVIIPRLRGTGIVTAYLRWHTSLQRETASLWGLVPQIALIGLCLALFGDAKRGQ